MIRMINHAFGTAFVAFCISKLIRIFDASFQRTLCATFFESVVNIVLAELYLLRCPGDD